MKSQIYGKRKRVRQSIISLLAVLTMTTTQHVFLENIWNRKRERERSKKNPRIPMCANL